MAIRAVLFDFGGVYTSSPFSVFAEAAAELGATPERVIGLVFGPYDRDTDHPWHRLERGEVSLARRPSGDHGARVGGRARVRPARDSRAHGGQGRRARGGGRGDAPAARARPAHRAGHQQRARVLAGLAFADPDRGAVRRGDRLERGGRAQARSGDLLARAARARRRRARARGLPRRLPRQRRRGAPARHARRARRGGPERRARGARAICLGYTSAREGGAPMAESRGKGRVRDGGCDRNRLRLRAGDRERRRAA